MQLHRTIQLLFSLYFVSTTLAAVAVTRHVYATRTVVSPDRTIANKKYVPTKEISDKNPESLTIKGKTTKFEIFGYIATVTDLPSNDLKKMEALAKEAFVDMESKHTAAERTNAALRETDAKKRAGVSQPPTMLTVMRPGSQGTKIYIHSSVKGTAWKQGQLYEQLDSLNPGEMHASLSNVLNQCAAEMQDTHNNEAHCGEIMSVNMWAKAVKSPADDIDLALIPGKLLVTVARPTANGPITVMSPCHIDATKGKTWGCRKFTAQVGFEVCEISWTSPAEVPTDEQFKGLKTSPAPAPRTPTKRDGILRRARVKTPTPKKRPTPGSTVQKPVQRPVPGKVKPPKTLKPGQGKPPKKTTPNQTTPRGSCPLKRKSLGGFSKRGTRKTPGTTKRPVKKTGGTKKPIGK